MTIINSKPKNNFKNNYGSLKIFCIKSVVPQRRISPTNEKTTVYMTKERILWVLRLRGNRLTINHHLKCY